MNKSVLFLVCLSGTIPFLGAAQNILDSSKLQPIKAPNKIRRPKSISGEFDSEEEIEEIPFAIDPSIDSNLVKLSLRIFPYQTTQNKDTIIVLDPINVVFGKKGYSIKENESKESIFKSADGKTCFEIPIHFINIENRLLPISLSLSSTSAQKLKITIWIGRQFVGSTVVEAPPIRDRVGEEWHFEIVDDYGHTDTLMDSHKIEFIDNVIGNEFSNVSILHNSAGQPYLYWWKSVDNKKTGSFEIQVSYDDEHFTPLKFFPEVEEIGNRAYCFSLVGLSISKMKVIYKKNGMSPLESNEIIIDDTSGISSVRNDSE